MKERLLYIDYLKAFAIILVVLGHIIQFFYCPTSYDDNHLFRYIYSFHMPLFMALSGFCCNFENISFIEVVKKRSIALLLPFFSWSIIRMFMGGANIVECVLYPDSGLWFLWVLYWINIFFVVTKIISVKINLKFIYCLFFLFVILLVCRALLKDKLGMSLIFTHSLYFVLGYYLKKYNVLSKYSWIFIHLILIWLIAGWFWMRSVPPTFLSSQTSFAKFFFYFWNYLSAVSGTIGFMAIFQKLFAKSRKNQLFAYIGKNTLAIYVIHFSLIRIIWNLFSINDSLMNFTWFLNPLQIAMSLMCIVAGSLAIHKMLSIESHLSFLLFGRK